MHPRPPFQSKRISKQHVVRSLFDAVTDSQGDVWAGPVLHDAAEEGRNVSAMLILAWGRGLDSGCRPEMRTACSF